MSHFTQDPEVLRHDWSKLYLNIMILKSHNPSAKPVLDDFRPESAKCNEQMNQFLDSLDDAITVRF